MIQARRLTDLNWFAQVSRVKGIIVYTQSAVVLTAGLEKNMHAHTYTCTRAHQFIITRIAPFCPKIIFKVGSVTCINNAWSVMLLRMSSHTVLTVTD